MTDGTGAGNVNTRLDNTGNAGPSKADGFLSSALDGSGWNVNFGNGSISSSASKNDPSSQGAGTDNMTKFILLGLSVLVILKLARKKRG